LLSNRIPLRLLTPILYKVLVVTRFTHVPHLRNIPPEMGERFAATPAHIIAPHPSTSSPYTHTLRKHILTTPGMGDIHLSRQPCLRHTWDTSTKELSYFALIVTVLTLRPVAVVAYSVLYAEQMFYLCVLRHPAARTNKFLFHSYSLNPKTFKVFGERHVRRCPRRTVTPRFNNVRLETEVNILLMLCPPWTRRSSFS